VFRATGDQSARLTNFATNLSDTSAGQFNLLGGLVVRGRHTVNYEAARASPSAFVHLAYR